MAVLRPLKVVITNYPAEQTESLVVANHPKEPAFGTRTLSFGRELYIERDDFMEDPPGKYFRLAPGREVRLRYAYLIRCDEVVKDPLSGEVVELRCSYDPASGGGETPDGRKVKGIIHWVTAAQAVPATVHLYDRLFSVPNPAGDKGRDYRTLLNPGSLEVLDSVLLEPAAAAAAPGSSFQFERLGYFCVDPQSTPQRPVFNRTVTLRDSWAKVAAEA
jgi:glutaminyl-tRNA synthetase